MFDFHSAEWRMHSRTRRLFAWLLDVDMKTWFCRILTINHPASNNKTFQTQKYLIRHFFWFHLNSLFPETIFLQGVHSVLAYQLTTDSGLIKGSAAGPDGPYCHVSDNIGNSWRMPLLESSKYYIVGLFFVFTVASYSELGPRTAQSLLLTLITEIFTTENWNTKQTCSLLKIIL